MLNALLICVVIFGGMFHGQVDAAHRGNSSDASLMAKHYGHGTPPLSPMRDMDHNVYAVGSLKGHWTLLYFWADWCVPCIQEGIPDLIAFSNAHSNSRDRYRIVAIRFNSKNEAGDWNDFHAKTLKLEKSLWRAEPPFPVVYDESTRVTSDWGIHELPTYALIDPQGNLVRGGDLAKLAAGVDGKKTIRPGGH